MNKNLEQESIWLLRDKYNGIECEEYFKDLEDLKSGKPLAYIIGWMPFFGAKIFLDSKPLIPRTETEYLVEKICESLVKKDLSDFSILDLCAGSGCIGVAIAKKFPSIEVAFEEIDKKHHETIGKNLRENDLNESNYKIYSGNLFENIESKYKLIITNPPYIDENKSDRIQSSVRGHEPDLALFGGKDGMEIINEILNKYKKYLKDDGELYLEHEPEQREAISEFPGFIETLKDQFGVNRFSKFGK